MSRKQELEKQLRLSQRMEILGVLAGGVAHDFNNLLTGILGFAELGLKSTGPTSEAGKRFNGIITASNRAKDLVKKILSFSRMGELPNQSVELGALVREAIGLLRASIPKMIEIKFVCDAPSVNVLGDPSQFHQIIMNLCTNAYHAIGNTSGMITINLTTDTVDLDHPKRGPLLTRGTYAKLTVSDTGTGIKPEILDRIFEPFFTTKEEGIGTGLGLSVVRGIVSASGGTVLVDSEIGKGTSFHIYIPLLDQPIVAQEEPTLNPASTEARVLFVDDEEMLVTIGGDILESLGCKATTTLTASEALAIFTKAPNDFDLIITDQSMPEMSGLQLAQKIHEIRKDIPIVLTTGFAKDISLSNCRSIGIVQILSKPYSLAEISQAISNAGKK